MEGSDQNGNKSKRIAILLPNPCNPDFRVIKQAEAYAKAGHDVRVYCRGAAETPEVERVNGVVYVRQSITASILLREYVERFLISLGIGRTSKKNRVHLRNIDIESQIHRLSTEC